MKLKENIHSETGVQHDAVLPQAPHTEVNVCIINAWICFYMSYSHSDKERLPGSEARWGVFLHQGQGAETKLVDWLIGVQWGEIGVHLAIILGNVEAVGINILTVERCDIWVWRETEKECVTQKWLLTRVCTHLSLGSLPSLVYCQQMSPMRSWTRALAMVTTVIGCIFSWAICIER